MAQIADPVVLTVPRNVLNDIVQLSGQMTDRMHQLLERNTDGQLSETEQSELATLVRIAQFGQIVSMALNPKRVSP